MAATRDRDGAGCASYEADGRLVICDRRNPAAWLSASTDDVYDLQDMR